jgi:serine/threonine protein kinase
VANGCNYAHQAAQEVQPAREHGMVHRDIKFSNLMLTCRSDLAVIKVLDFGLAKVKSESPTDGTLTYKGQMLGTPEFIFGFGTSKTAARFRNISVTGPSGGVLWEVLLDLPRE